jgi:hypothetical protein
MPNSGQGNAKKQNGDKVSAKQEAGQTETKLYQRMPQAALSKKEESKIESSKSALGQIIEEIKGENE